MNLTRSFQNIFVLIVSLTLSLLASEALLRTTSLGDIHVTETGNQYKFYEFDGKLGWKNGADRYGQYTRDEFSYRISINSHGMRYREVEKKRRYGLKRVAVLGDSFVWGIGVADQDRFTEMVEMRSNGRYELLNFGVSGYGPIQYYLMLDEIVAEFQPDVILITFCLGNDFADNVFWQRYSYYKPYVKESLGQELVIAGYPLPRSGEFNGGFITDWLADNSRLFALVMSSTKRAAAVVKGYDQAGLIGADENEKDIYFPRHSLEAAALADRMVALNTKLLTQIRDKAKAHNVPIAVVVAPTKCEYGACFHADKVHNMNARDVLMKTLSELDIPAIDKTEGLDLSDFWKTDGHWRPSGHAKVAEGILDWLDSIPLPNSKP